MRRVNSRNLQTAQGMVEFALVLPILLLVMFGIFAFGHFFFAYSSVVSASRDAARWGSAVGLTENLLPRYNDCDAIRDTAARVGSFAGVRPVDGPDNDTTPGIYVGFDHGPLDPDPDYDDCSDDEGPSDVAYGDRINVRVTILYHTIVPLVNIPDIPISATTSRTIVHTLPVGENPIAAPHCQATAIDLDYVDAAGVDIFPAPVVGQPVYVNATVRASDGTLPAGRVVISDNVGHTCPVMTVPGAPPCLLAPNGYETADTYFIDASFTRPVPAPAGQCYDNQTIDNDPLVVNPAETSVVITSHVNNPSWPGELITVSYQVTVDPPGNRTPAGPTGSVTVTGNDGVNPAQSCSGSLNIVTGTGSCSGGSLYPTIDTALTAAYTGDDNFNPSVSEPVIHLVGAQSTPEPPPYCPFVVANSFVVVNRFGQHGGQFEVSNANGPNVLIDHIEVTWPPEPAVPIQEIRFGPYLTIGGCVTNGPPGNRNCLWQNDFSANGFMDPPYRAISSSVSNWRSEYADLNAGGAKVMRILFADIPPTGDYTVHIHFSNDCVLDLTGDFAP